MGYYAAYTVAIGCAVTSMLYAMLFLKDSMAMRPVEALKEAETNPDGPDKSKEKDGYATLNDT